MKKILPVILGSIITLVSSCGKNKYPVTVTNEISKIETIWDGISEKKEGFADSPKIETSATDEIRNAIRERLNQENENLLKQYSTPIQPNFINGNWVGVIKHSSTPGPAGCGGWDELEIYMDCEDSNPKTQWLSTDPYLGSLSPTYSYHPSSWVVNGNVTMKFCIVPGAEFHPFASGYGSIGYGYAVLRVTTNFLSDAREVSRYFDNQDGNNTNSAILRFGINRTPARNNTTLSVFNATGNNDNSIYRTVVNGNSYLSFHIFQNNTGSTQLTDYPSLNGLSYAVFGGEGAPNPNFNSSTGIGLLKIDDEDNNNTDDYLDDEYSYSKIDLWGLFRNIAEGRNGDFPSIAPGHQTPLTGKDTWVYITRAK